MHEMTLEELFLQSVEALPLILRGLGRENRLSPEELEDLQSDIQVKLLEDDYRVLRLWDSRSSLKFYLATVVNNIWRDRVRGEKGRVRVSVAAERLGPAAKELEILMRQGFTFDEAYQVIKPRFPDLSRDEAEKIAVQIKPRRGRQKEHIDVVAGLPGLEPTPYKHLELQKKLAEKRRAFALMRGILSELPKEDRILLLAAHAEGVKFSRIARSLGIDQRPLYRRNERLLEELRADLEEAGIRWEDLREVVGIDARREFNEAHQAIEPRFPGLSRSQAEEIVAQILLPRPSRRFESEDGVAQQLYLEKERTGDERFKQREKRKAIALMYRILSELPEQDFMLLKRAHAEGIKFPRIAESLGIDQRSLYRRNEKLIKKLRTDLGEAGIRWEDLGEVLSEALGMLSSETGPGEMAKTETCITPTDLAAFLEGSLKGEERDRMVRHLNHCVDCFDRYIGAARLLDAIEEEEASAFSAADGNRAVDPNQPT